MLQFNIMGEPVEIIKPKTPFGTAICYYRNGMMKNVPFYYPRNAVKIIVSAVVLLFDRLRRRQIIKRRCYTRNKRDK